MQTRREENNFEDYYNSAGLELSFPLTSWAAKPLACSAKAGSCIRNPVEVSMDIKSRQ